MSNLTTEEKIYLVECFFSRGKVYSNAYRGFRTKYGTHKVKSENTLKRIIDNFMQYGTIQDRRHDLPGPSVSVAAEENIEDIKKYFEENPNSSIRKAAQALEISKTTLHRILKHFLKMHPYKITSHQLLTKRAMTKRVEFCKTINGMFEKKRGLVRGFHFMQDGATPHRT
ncbi:hypothetical protein X777_09599 [Ooceraea biroi]|uniref:DUF4817 domain-containing protein n=1 Tax=Ooceraea biroi TaxID=2015173 RepID=A0A026W7K4_OOCBI|nr:hypothetical protein X777_09599 [Ooceraea biroi]